MARHSVVSCDWCEEETSIIDDEELDLGWLVVCSGPIEEPVIKEFCCVECLVNHYQ